MGWRRLRRVRLHMTDGKPSIEGFFHGRAAGHYHLKGASLLEAPGRSHEVGEVFVPAEQVAFYQVVSE